MNSNKIIFWALTVSIGGFLFGFDTAVISGGEQAIQEQWKLSSTLIGQMVASALYGTIIGALFGGIPADKIGRKKTLIWIAALYLLCAVGSALAPDIYTLMFFRFIGGLSIGASSAVAPMYITEISPEKQRGRLTALFQFNIVFGILVSYLSNWMIGNTDDTAWRTMLAVAIVPSVLFLIMIFLVPESPRWLAVKKGDLPGARKILAIINPGTVEASLAAITAPDPSGEAPAGNLMAKKYRLPVILAFLIAFFNQLSGINAVIYFAPRIFKMTGMEASSSLLSSVGIGVVNLIFTMLGLALIDRMGRRFLMYIGSIGYIVSLSLVAYAFTSGNISGMIVPVLLFVFIASHAIGQGAVIWVFISEIFPNEVRAWGNSLGCTTHWVFAAIITAVFPPIAEAAGGGPVFAFFAVMMVLQLLFVWKLMPETKGMTLEELEAKLIK